MQKNIPQLRNLLTVLFLALSLGTVRAQIRGTVVDADDGYGVPYANVMIPATRENIACDGEGNFKLPRGHVTKIVVSSVGYEKQSVVIPAGTDSITVSLKSSDNSLAEVRVKARRKRYHRKDNPAVELMRRVIAKKKVTNLENHDYYRCRKYQKITLSENEVDTVGKNRKPWYLNHLDKSPIDSTKLILPVTINEQITERCEQRVHAVTNQLNQLSAEIHPVDTRQCIPRTLSDMANNIRKCTHQRLYAVDDEINQL